MIRRLAPFIALMIALVASFGLWWWLGRPHLPPEVPGNRLACVSFTPWEGEASPLRPDFVVDAARIEKALLALQPLTSCVRLYSAIGPYPDVVEIADRLGIEVLLGIWISGDNGQNGKEIAAAIDLAGRYPKAVRLLIVGNEVLLRREMSGRRLAEVVNSVKKRTAVPVAYADIQHFWIANPEVAAAVDVMAIHVLPYWDDPVPVSIDAVQEHVRDVISEVGKAFPDKKLMIGEIGWPSAGRSRGEAAPGLVNQARFVREFAAWAETENIDYNIIEGWDQPWKRAPEGTVGGFWGVLDRDLAPKFHLKGPVSEWPGWRAAALFTGAVSLALLGMAAFGRRPTASGWLGLGLLGPALGASLVGIGFMMESVPMDIAGRAGVAWLGLLTLGGAGLLFLRIEAHMVKVYHWAVILTALFLALGLAVDGRHRDFPTVGLWLPALALAVHAWRGGRGHGGDPRQKAWAALVLALAGPLAIDWRGNLEAVAWAMVVLLLAAPWLTCTLAEFRRLRTLFLQPDQR